MRGPLKDHSLLRVTKGFRRYFVVGVLTNRKPRRNIGALGIRVLFGLLMAP